MADANEVANLLCGEIADKSRALAIALAEKNELTQELAEARDRIEFLEAELEAIKRDEEDE